jgi:malate dehydrogenase (oxaloacetate-decarboxylating)
MKSRKKTASTKGGNDDQVSRGDTLTLRLKLSNKTGTLGRVTTSIGKHGGDIGGIDIVGQEDDCTVRDITVNVASAEVGNKMVAALKRLRGVKVVNVSNRTFLLHLGGKLRVVGKNPIRTREELGQYYTPHVADVCMAIHADRDKARTLTIKGNTVLVVTDGSRVLALGNIGPYAAAPVMEGKCMLFQEFGGVNAFPICLDTQDIEQVIATIKNIAPMFGGINLEDIASPGCWEIERRLKAELDIPIFHDDQHGTAVVTLAATLNAVRLVGKQMSDLRVVASGVGAAGMACCKLLMKAGVKNLIGFNQGGAIFRGRQGMNSEEQWLAENSNPENFQGTLKEGMVGADMFLGLSVANVIEPKDVAKMNKDGIVFALANPIPEVDPIKAGKYARIIATGGSHYPNQINNALVFPGIFRGALDARVRDITDEMKMEAARALAAVIPPDQLRDDYIIPSIFNPDVHKAVAQAVAAAAHDNGQAGRPKRVR